MLHEDMYVVARDFWRAVDLVVDEEGIERPPAAQTTLFDPDAFAR
jgi:hypothetical protein